MPQALQLMPPTPVCQADSVSSLHRRFCRCSQAWHYDLGERGFAARRKVSVTVQLSDPREYDGGDLELMDGTMGGGSTMAPAEQGCAAAFPSYLLHRVTPVTRGVRYVVVAWFAGERSFR